MTGPGRTESARKPTAGHHEADPTALLHAATLALAGAGLLAGVTGAAVAGLLRQARSTARRIEHAQHEVGPVLTQDPALAEAALTAARLDGSYAPSTWGAVGGAAQQAADATAQRWLPRGDGVYGPTGELVDGAPDGAGGVLRLAMLGDSTAVGFGCTVADELPGVMLARGLARAAGRPVALRTLGVVGVGAADLDRQLALVGPGGADVVVVVVGANDIRDKVSPHLSARLLGAMVGEATRAGMPVAVGTCPDFGVIGAIPQPLRTLLRTWSHRLADQQAREVIRAGGEPVAIGQLVSPEFAGRPELFAADRFHPSGAGYARAVDALLPAVLRAVLGGDEVPRPARPAE
ncbi:SGNH/GDSL hydrolase family protein [Nakamurella flavida]|uniref:SGNH/GDSL hydrolase family protein n=1 Tax=Nakamurella flavida TaxID=363630 RepID=A0A939C5H2_9ACTN|nr:SGNH/GDSL hydrolase family protein [Nakamurella flavida]MBM9476879.1 SGNH/GDSL hydrolase family protein [Nakamurella flavida]MDP9779823.1 lysophospholipase L1-like esterase [Nakamurella flavida]